MRGVRKTRRSQYYRSVERGANAKESNRYTGTELTSDSLRYFAISSTIRVNFSNPIRPTGMALADTDDRRRPTNFRWPNHFSRHVMDGRKEISSSVRVPLNFVFTADDKVTAEGLLSEL